MPYKPHKHKTNGNVMPDMQLIHHDTEQSLKQESARRHDPGPGIAKQDPGADAAARTEGSETDPLSSSPPVELVRIT